jgi:hypothetical protein
MYYDLTEALDGSIILKIKSHAVASLMGYQTTLRWDPGLLRLEGISSNPTGMGVGERWKNEGYLTLSWNDPKARGVAFSDGMELLELRFRKTSFLGSTSVTLSDEHLVREAFNGQYQSVAILMLSKDIVTSVNNSQLRVFPNPAGRDVNVEWKSLKRGEVTLRLLDATGRVVYEHRDMYDAGLQRHTVRRTSGGPVSGTWVIQVLQDGISGTLPVIFARQAPLP